MISIVAFGGEKASGLAICNSSEVKFVSPSVLSKLYYNLVITSKLTKRGVNKHKSAFC